MASVSGIKAYSSTLEQPNLEQGIPATGRALQQGQRSNAPLHNNRLNNTRSPIPHLATSAEIFARIDELRQQRAHCAEIVTYFRQLFGDILHRETGFRQFELCAGLLPSVFRGAELMIATLARFMFALNEAARSTKRTDREALLDQGAELIAWYFQRRAVLDLIEYESDNRDYLLPLAVNEDATVSGAPGIEVICAVKLFHRARQQLYVTLTFRDEGRPIQRTTSWLAQYGLEFSSQETRGEVCAIIPLMANCHHEVFDQVRLGVPYASLQLEPGWHNLDTILRIVDEQGDLIAEREEGRVLFVSPSAHTQEPRAPQSRGVWEYDPSTGSRIDDLSVYQSGTDKVTVSFAVAAGALTATPLAVRCIPRSRDGFDLLREETPRNKILYEVETVRPYQSLGTFYWHFTLSELELNPREREIYFDIAVLGERGKIIVGACRRLEFEINLDVAK